MMHVRRTLLLLLLTASPAAAADRTIINQVDLAATSYTYYTTSEYRQGSGRIYNASSNTVVNSVGGASIFGSMGSGDEVFVDIAGVTHRRVVSSKTATTMTLNTAIDLSANGSANGYAWRARDVSSSTASTAGWIAVKGSTGKLVYACLNLETGTGGVDVSVECRGSGDAAVPIQVLTFNLTGTTAPTNCEAAPIAEDCSDLRVGLKWGTADGAGPDSVTVVLGSQP